MNKWYAEDPKPDWVTKAKNKRRQRLKQKRQEVSRQSVMLKVATALC